MRHKVTLGSVHKGSEAFIIAEHFVNKEKSILYIARDDREIYALQSKLFWLLPKADILIFRSWDQIPYDNVSPSREIQSERIKTLYQLSVNKQKKIILSSVNAIIQRTVDQSFIKKNYVTIFVNQKLNFNHFIQQLISLGYQRTSVVREKTDFAIRGSIIDIFIVDRKNPLRIDFFDNNIESIYEFDRLTQKRLLKIENEKIYIHPSSELLINDETITLFRKNFREIFSNYRLSQVYNSFSESILPPGGEQFLPFFLEKMETFFNFVNDCQVIVNSQFNDLLENRIENINDFFKARKQLNDNFYLNKNIKYETDNYKLIRDLIKCNNSVVNKILLNFKIDNYNSIIEETLNRENIEVLKTLKTLNIPQNDIRIPIFDLKKESKDFYYYLFFNFLEDKTNFQEQYYLFALLIDDLNLFNEILDCWQVNELNKTNPQTIIRSIIENNKTNYLKSILKHKNKFEFFSQKGNALHICLLFQNVDCLKILFSYDIFVNEFENNILTKPINEYGSFLDIARKLILFRNF